MPTIMDVARKAGVSRSTVSLVINKSPLVKAATRELVEQVIREINYVPNSNARGLSARTTNNLGVVFMQDYMPSTQISYNNDQHIGICSFNISNGIMAGLAGTDYGVITERFCSIAAPDELPRMIREKRVDGLFVVGLPYSEQFIEIDGQRASVLVSRYNGKILRVIPNDEISRSANLSREQLLAKLK